MTEVTTIGVDLAKTVFQIATTSKLSLPTGSRPHMTHSRLSSAFANRYSLNHAEFSRNRDVPSGPTTHHIVAPAGGGTRYRRLLGRGWPNPQCHMGSLARYSHRTRTGKRR